MKKRPAQYLRRYCDLCSGAGDEAAIREAIQSDIEGCVDEQSVNPLGNLTVVKRGKVRDRSLLLTAHMDEVAFIVRSVEKNGLVKFYPIGGLVPKILPGNSVRIGKKGMLGIIAMKSYHLLSSQERGKVPEQVDLTIDVGASSEEEMRDVSPGDYIYFRSKFWSQHSRYFGKAFDDRVGCAAITSILNDYTETSPELTVVAVYTAQEEVGLRGGATAAFGVKNIIFNLNLEGTTCSDRELKPTYSPSTVMGLGPAVTIMDRTVVTHRRLLEWVLSLAKKHSVPFQMKETVSGGTDAGLIHLTEQGIPSVTVAVPIRYIHAPWGIVSRDDFDNYLRLARTIIREALQFPSDERP
jgi:endoglucanase